MKATDKLVEQLNIIMLLKHRQILNAIGDAAEKSLQKLPNDDNKSTQWTLKDINSVHQPLKSQETLLFEKQTDPAVLSSEALIEAAKKQLNETFKKENVIRLLS